MKALDLRRVTLLFGFRGLRLYGRQDGFAVALRGAFPDEMKMLLAHIRLSSVRRRVMKLTCSERTTHGGQVKLREDENRFRQAAAEKRSAQRRDTQIYITRGIGTVVCQCVINVRPKFL